jgi:hypothetical protein
MEIKIETPDPVPQADGFSESGSLPEDVTWIGEVDGKRYRGLGGESCCPYHRDGGLSGISCIPSKSGDPTDLPEGSH